MATKTRSEWLEDLQASEAEGNFERADKIRSALGMPAREAPEEGLQFSPMEMVKNIPGSAANLATGLYEAVTNPLETAQGMGQLFAGAGQKYQETMEDILPEPLQFLGASPVGMAAEALGMDYTPAAEAVGEQFMERYGSPQSALSTLEEDPVGAGMDLASVIAPVSGRIAARVNPATRGVQATASGGRLIPESVPESIMESATKFTKTISPEENRALVRTALDYGITPSQRGVSKLDDLISSSSAKVDDMINQATASGDTIPIGEVLKELRGLKRERGASIVSGPQDVSDINTYIDQLVDNAKGLGKTQLDASDLQSLKRDLYDRIAWDVRRGVSETPIKEDVFKTTARGARKQIEQLAPETAQANRELGRLLELKPHMERAARRIEDRDLIGMTDMISVGTGGALGMATGNPALGGAMFALSELMSNPKISPRVAQALEYVRRPGPIRENLQKYLVDNPTASQATIAAYVESLVEEDAAGRAYYEEEKGMLED